MLDVNRCVRLLAVLVATLVVTTTSVTSAQRIDVPARQDNPRHQRYQGLIIEHLSVTPRERVEQIGDRPQRPSARFARVTAHVRNLGRSAVEAEIEWGTHARTRTEPIDPGTTIKVSIDLRPSQIPYQQEIALRPLGPDGTPGGVVDHATLHHEQAMRVLLLVERDTLRDGDEMFGSFVRRMRQSFEDLHTILADEITTRPGESREPISDRFRIDHVIIYDRGDSPRPEHFDDHSEFDLAIACDEGGPLAGFWLPAYSIGHNFHNPAADKGLWSDWGEQALWHEMLHFRGVPDFYISRIPAEALPGRAVGPVDLPPAYARCIMNSPYQPPLISNLAARIVNSKAGVARVGACEETDHAYGHVWQWLPRRVRIQITHDGTPLRTARVRWYRARPADFPDARMQAVAADQDPDGSLRVNRLGEISLIGDYLGAADPRPERSLWLLIEVEFEDEKRFDILHGLWLNERFAEGDAQIATWSRDWNALFRLPADAVVND